MRKRCFALCMAALLLLTACSEERTADPGGEPAVSPESAGNTANEETTPPAGETEAESVEVVVEPYADGLNWIVEQNEKLPEGEKIRVVSVSAAPSGEWSPFTENLEMWDQAVEAAQAAGIVVLDCRPGEETGLIASAFFDPTAREDPTACTGGWPDSPQQIDSSQIGVPTSYRTVAEEYWEGEPSYQYDGIGGLSWGIPYAAGVLALGWQVAPELDGETMLQLLKDSCATAHDGSRIIDPAAFIEAVREAHGQS